MVRAYGVTDRGRVRTLNEDCFAIDEDLGLFIVADGMGGHNAGEVAARLAVDAVIDYVRHAQQAQNQHWPFGFNPSFSVDGNLLRTAIQLANARILQTAAASHAHTGMGTTIVAALVRGALISVAHVGDSRMYLFDGSRLRLLTADDSWTAAVLAREPRATAAILKHHPLRNALTSAVGARADLDVHVVETSLCVGELLLLSTDGLHDPLDDLHIERVLREGQSVASLPESLVSAALARGSRDNCTALVAEYLPDC
jgi:protein phosphatase